MYNVDGAVEVAAAAAGYAGAGRGCTEGGGIKGQAAEPGVWITNSLTSKMIILFLPQSVSA